LQVASLRGLSDHFPVSMSVDEENWGPRPLRMLKCWLDIPGYHQFVRSQVDGWGGFVVKEKLKLIKIALKEWHLTHTKNLLGRIQAIKSQIDVLESRGTTMFYQKRKWKSCILCQSSFIHYPGSM
jgi:hypothetical protein